jgi:hypothetical protein
VGGEGVRQHRVALLVHLVKALELLLGDLGLAGDTHEVAEELLVRTECGGFSDSSGRSEGTGDRGQVVALGSSCGQVGGEGLLVCPPRFGLELLDLGQVLLGVAGILLRSLPKVLQPSVLETGQLLLLLAGLDYGVEGVDLVVTGELLTPNTFDEPVREARVTKVVLDLGLDRAPGASGVPVEDEVLGGDA